MSVTQLIKAVRYKESNLLPFKGRKTNLFLFTGQTIQIYFSYKLEDLNLNFYLQAGRLRFISMQLSARRLRFSFINRPEDSNLFLFTGWNTQIYFQLQAKRRKFIFTYRPEDSNLFSFTGRNTDCNGNCHLLRNLLLLRTDGLEECEAVHSLRRYVVDHRLAVHGPLRSRLMSAQDL